MTMMMFEIEVRWVCRALSHPGVDGTKEDDEMPRGDGTGPMGMGSMTGRATGYCAGFRQPGYMTPGPGRGSGCGRGYGRGFGRGFGWRAWGFRGAGFRNPASGIAAPGVGTCAGPWGARKISREEELEYLKGQADTLRQEMDAISGRIGQIESEQRSGTVEEE